MNMRNIWGKLRYSNFMRLVIDAVGTTGIKISPIYLVEEMIPEGISPKLHPDTQEHTVEYAHRDEVNILADTPVYGSTRETYITRIDEGQQCLIMKCAGEPAAFIWVDRARCSVSGCEFPLRPNEAYLFDAYTVTKYRGKGIAPYLRYQCYTQLAKEGRTVVYSAVDVFNRPARTVLTKLHARMLEFWIRIFFFGKWRLAFNVKQYHESSDTIKDSRS